MLIMSGSREMILSMERCLEVIVSLRDIPELPYEPCKNASALARQLLACRVIKRKSSDWAATGLHVLVELSAWVIGFMSLNLHDKATRADVRFRGACALARPAHGFFSSLKSNLRNAP